jgi:hypothetical protein
MYLALLYACAMPPTPPVGAMNIVLQGYAAGKRVRFTLPLSMR